MLAELAAANAAFAVIKTAVQNGKDIASAGNAIAQFVVQKDTTTEVSKKAAAPISKSLRPMRKYGKKNS